MGKVRDAERTRGRIVEAAVREFAEKGFAGARVESIGRRAGVNKQLLYHYFGGKEDLFREVVERKIEERLGRLEGSPDELGGLLEYHFEGLYEDLDWIRFLTWEAAERGDEPLLEEERRESIARQVGDLREKRARGDLPPDLDPRYLQLAVYALTAYPVAFAQITRMTTGEDPESPEFREAWRGFLRRFAKLGEGEGQPHGGSR
ncbi:TetR family transcriptional regulator [Rubrobacter marinus]|uniref:TetR family transcriptional regulator n=1 Tax=Rubrobacter marinus TaxID=2653852 RepID=A0A6G8PTV8_9ACTN|nr:TetR/AcrR family transcriptional regulator [Rubrobacter marinus]QIN77948.1 TetR family transcriptional regulator [Rubrobacter marinus]